MFIYQGIMHTNPVPLLCLNDELQALLAEETWSLSDEALKSILLMIFLMDMDPTLSEKEGKIGYQAFQDNYRSSGLENEWTKFLSKGLKDWNHVCLIFTLGYIHDRWEPKHPELQKIGAYIIDQWFISLKQRRLNSSQPQSWMEKILHGLNVFDDYMIDHVFQPSTDWIASITGIGHRKIARGLLHASAIGMIIDATRTMTAYDWGIMMGMSAVCLVFNLCVIGTIILIGSTGDGIGFPSQTIPAARINYRMLRNNLALGILMGIPMSVVDYNSGILVLTLEMCIWLSSAYCFACHSNPPPAKNIPLALPQST
jgi:hypothetical protein